MSEEPKRKRRVVSKSAYLGHLGIKAGGNIVGTGFILVGSGGVLLTLCGLLVLLILPGQINSTEETQSFVQVFLVLDVVSMLISGWLVWLGARALKTTSEMEPVVPLTRQTASQLPPEESLVRPSSEPSQPQEKVLLRAAGSGQETPAEELLRASGQE